MRAMTAKAARNSRSKTRVSYHRAFVLTHPVSASGADEDGPRPARPTGAMCQNKSSPVSLTLAAVAAQATGTPSPSVATWYLVPLLARSVGLGPVRSPPRLARTEQVSRIGVEDQVGVAAQHRSEERRVGTECRSRWWPYH